MKNILLFRVITATVGKMQNFKHAISLPQVLPDLCQLFLLWWNSSRLLWGSGAERRTSSVPFSLSPLHLFCFVPGRWASPQRQVKSISHCTHDLWTFCTHSLWRWIRFLRKPGVCAGELQKEKNTISWGGGVYTIVPVQRYTDANDSQPHLKVICFLSVNLWHVVKVDVVSVYGENPQHTHTLMWRWC